MIRAFGKFWACLLLSTGFAWAAAEPLPEPLRGWSEWVLHGARDRACPVLLGQDQRICGWPGRLELALTGTGGRFRLGFRAYRQALFTLPGDARRWPQDVKVDGKPVPVVTLRDRPTVELNDGEHTIEGAFIWDQLPEMLALPEEMGWVSATVDGRPVPATNREGGQLLLRRDLHGADKGGASAAVDALELRVYRRVVDEIPLKILTRMDLQISGSEREVLLEGASLPGFLPMQLEGGLTARVEPDGKLRLQLRPGRFSVVLTSRSTGPVSELAAAGRIRPWPDSELWVFEPHSELRQVTIEGVAALDPQQTTLPPEWRGLPTYALAPGKVMKLVETQRGQPSAAPDRLSLRRNLWLDFDGGGFSAQDRLWGSLPVATRLEAGNGMTLGRVLASGAERLITRLKPDASEGVELRQGLLNLQSDARLPRSGLSAVGWDLDVQSLAMTVQLPPGWRLFHASGADRVDPSWVGSWSLLDLFLVLVTCVATLHLYGRATALWALLALVLVYPEESAPKAIWLAALAAEALVRALHHPSFNRWVRGLRLVARVWIALWTVGFAFDHVREGLYPQLERGWDQLGDLEDSGAYQKRAQEERLGSLKSTPDEAEANDEVAVAADASAPASAEVMAERERVQPKMAKRASMGGRGIAAPFLSPEVDPRAATQTGPGLPRWSWRQVSLGFSGPVERTQSLELWLLSPGANLFLALLRIALLAGLLIKLFEVKLPGPGSWFKRLKAPAAAALPLGLGLGLLVSPNAARAETAPAPELLNELRQRLLEKPECSPQCISISKMGLEVTSERLRIRLGVSSAVRGALPLPGRPNEWAPESITLDGKPVSGLVRTTDGVLWLALEPGLWQVTLEGALPERDQVQLALPARPHWAEASVQGWKLTGLHEDGQVGSELQLTRRAPASAAAGLEGRAPKVAAPLPPFVRVERILNLGLTWSVTTRVERLTPSGATAMLELPLLEGESVTTPEIRVVDRKVHLSLAPASDSVEWTSVLKVAPSIDLEAARQLSWVEVWRVDASPVWHVEAQGVPAVAIDGAQAPEYRPWPGEKLALTVTRPAPVEGQTLTVDGSSLVVTPGRRSTDMILRANLRASRAELRKITLPESATVQSVSLDGKELPLKPEGRTLSVPIPPGVSSLQLSVRSPTSLVTLFRVPAVDLGGPSVNSLVELHIDGRWVLAVGGTRVGPAVLFWGFLIVWLAIAVALGRLKWTPLKPLHWVLLFLGLSQVPLEAASLVVGWLLLLGFREERGANVLQRWRFNVMQLMLVGLTVSALSVMATSIYGGLLGAPQMQVQGNGSTASLMRWYQDRVGSELPRPWALSVPLWVYRAAMLGWALWLSFALMRWLRWGWGAFGRGGLWRPKPPTANVAPPAPGGSGPPAPTAGRAHH